MNSTNANVMTGGLRKGWGRKAATLFAPDWPMLKIIVSMVFVWFLLAQFAIFLYPDTQANLGESAQQYLGYALRNGMLYVLFFFGLAAIKMMKASSQEQKGQSVIPYFLRQIKQSTGGDRTKIYGTLSYFLIAMGVFVVYMYAYSTIKTRIPNIMPYSWDAVFQKWDNTIFLGRDPWQYFAFLYEYPLLIRAIDFIYDFWAVVMVCVWFYVLRFGGKDKARRDQYIIALMLTWFVGGNLLAILLSSGGPVYYEALTGLSSTYSEQMAQLAAINAETPLRALPYQDMLWQVYESPSVGFGGISAMPSMHCASSFLLLLMFGRTKLSKTLLTGFFLFILMSSFILGWHYAVDGLLVIPVVYTCWKLAGYIISKIALPAKTAN